MALKNFGDDAIHCSKVIAAIPQRLAYCVLAEWIVQSLCGAGWGALGSKVTLGALGLRSVKQDCQIKQGNTAATHC